MANRLTISWNGRCRTLLDGLREIAAGEARAVAFVSSVLVLLMLLRQAVQFAIAGDASTRVTLSEVAGATWDDSLQHGLPVLAMYSLIQPVRRLARLEGWRRAALLAGTVVVAGLLATFMRALQMAVADGSTLGEVMDPLNACAVFVRFALPAAFIVAVAEFQQREIQSLEAMRHAEADRAALEQETLLARLKTLEAQIEPHFLFNTLANVRRLYETDPGAGETMLERLMRYLVVALPTMRDELPTLGREAQLIEAYLDLQQVRMGRRLSYSIDIAPALRDVAVPSMMLLTLVENAIKHGLAPLREGGRIDVAARVEDGDLRLEVADTGRGFGSPASGMGAGLANVQARLAAMFGAAAELSLVPRQVHGLLATIRMPLRSLA